MTQYKVLMYNKRNGKLYSTSTHKSNPKAAAREALNKDEAPKRENVRLVVTPFSMFHQFKGKEL